MPKDPYASLKQGLVGAWIPSVSGSGLLLPDLSGRGNNGALTNMDASDWVSSGTGRALDFDGVNDRVETTDIPADGLSALTLSGWFLTRSISVDYAMLFSKYTSGSSRFEIHQGGSGIGNPSSLAAVMSNGSEAYGYTATGLITTDVWYHVAFVFNGSESTNATRLRLLLNGVQRSLTFVGTIPTTTPTNTGIFRIGAETPVFYHYNGQLDDVRIYNRALSDSEILLLASDRGIGFKPNKKLSRFSTRYTYNPPKAKVYHTVKVRERDHKNLREGLVGAWCPSLSGSGNLLPDVSGRNNHGTLTNMGPEDWVSSQGGRALDFDGVNDYVAVPHAQRLNFTAEFSFAAWVVKTSSSACNLLGKQNVGVNDGNYAVISQATNNLQFGFVTSVGNTRWSTTGAVFTLNAITHVAITIRFDAASAATIKAYANGVEQSGSWTTASGIGIPLTNTNPVAIFAASDGSINHFPGQLLEMRLYNRILTDPEIRLLASRRGIGLQHLSHRSYAKEKKTGLRRLLLTGQT